MNAYEVVNGTTCCSNPSLDLYAILGANQKDTKSPLENTKYSLNYIPCLGVLKIKKFFLILRAEMFIR